MPMMFKSSSAAWAAVTRPTGWSTAVTAMVPWYIRAGDNPLQVALKELFHVPGIGSGTAEEGRRLKGPGTGPHSEVFGVQHDAGQDSLSLDF